MNQATIIRTAEASGEKFAAVTPPPIRPANAATEQDALVTVMPQRRYQTVIGFGGALTEAAASQWLKLSSAKRQQALDAYYSPDGLRYNLGRTHMNSCDFSLENYACCGTPGDLELKTFSLDRERRYILPLIRAAQQTAAPTELKLFFSPWSPPAWMKDSGMMNRNGKLLPQYREVWAEYYCRFVEEMAKEGVNFKAFTVQNEPMAAMAWENCYYSAEEERDFVRDHLGPALQRHHLQHLKLMVWDHNRYRLFDRVQTIYGDPEAAKYVWGAAYHWYCHEGFDNLRYTHELFPDKHLIFSEGCQEGGPHLGEYAPGERYAHNIINDFNNFCEAWVDWNIFLNPEGGPNHEQNFCSAPVIIDPENDELLLQPSYYYIGHFSRHIAPGAKRILSLPTSDNLESAAFLNPNGDRVLVLLNRSNTAEVCTIKEDQTLMDLDFPAHSITTLILK